MIQVITATTHSHNRYAIQEWFQEKVDLIALSPTPRQPMSRDYMNRIVGEIHENVQRIALSSRVFFLVTGHPFFNLVAVYALKERMGDRPFLLLVYDGEEYHAWGSNFVLDYPRMGDVLKGGSAES